MFYYLNGTITLLDANLAVVDCGGVGYACHTTNYTLARLQLGKPAKLFTYCNIKEDAFDIFGFSTREELNCFERLLGVTGVGPKAALAILSVVSPEQLTLAVMTQDDKTITMAQGVGKKLAQRIILELKDKLGASQLELNTAEFSGSAAPGLYILSPVSPEELPYIPLYTSFHTSSVIPVFINIPAHTRITHASIYTVFV